MQKILLLFATREGQTEKIATRIATQLREAGADVRCIDVHDAAEAGSLDLDGFDLLVFGGSMHAGGIEKELVTFINDNARRITAKPRSFFLVLLSAATKDPELRARWIGDARDKMNAQLEVDFDDVEMIAGALKYSKYPAPLKWMMRRIAAQAGEDTDTSKDYEYTDWQQVEAYAARLAVRSGSPD